MVVPTMSDMMANNETPEVLFWVGCAGSFDQRAKTFTLKKVLLLFCILLISVQTFSFSTKNSASSNITYIVPGNLKGFTIQEFLKLTPKKYQELTGKKMSFKQKLAFEILKLKLKKQLPDEKTAAHKTDIGLLSLIFGGSAFVLAIIPYLGFVSIPLALAAIVLGILGLGRKKGDKKSITGLVLGSVYLLFALVAIAVITSIRH